MTKIVDVEILDEIPSTQPNNDVQNMAAGCCSIQIGCGKVEWEKSAKIQVIRIFKQLLEEFYIPRDDGEPDTLDL